MTTLIEVPSEITVDLEAEILRAEGIRIEFVVALQNGVKFEIFANEHPPPHFHVSRGGAKASFDLKTGKLLEVTGGDRTMAKIVCKRFGKLQPELIRVWNERRPADCQVGCVKIPFQ